MKGGEGRGKGGTRLNSFRILFSGWRCVCVCVCVCGLISLVFHPRLSKVVLCEGKKCLCVGASKSKIWLSWGGL